uniref:Uncharacterized protein n=1 Tax=viral metagenome TaxID=1070528 RepID=A0A6C0HZF3_9ZZZZ
MAAKAEATAGIFAERMKGLDEDDEIKIGIYIACHGELIERTVNGTRNVTINKQNLGGYGCASFKVREPSEHIQTALSLEKGLVGCSRQEYQAMKKDERDKRGEEIDTEGACERFSSMRGLWVLKNYSYDATKRAFIIAFQGRTMDMFTCTRPELEAFILGKPGSLNAKDQPFLDDFFTHKDIPVRVPNLFTFFNTQILFNLIYLFNKYQRVNVANILDESCNVQSGRDRDHVYPRGYGVGYGGKRTRKYRKSKTKRRK